MSKYKLRNILSKLSRSSSDASLQLPSILKTPPEPTTTLLGTERGKALFDPQSPSAKGANDSASLARSPSPISSLFSHTSSFFSRRSDPSKRKIKLTEGGAEIVKGFCSTKLKSEKIQRGKARRLADSLNCSAASNFASDDDTDGRQPTQEVDNGTQGLPGLPSVTLAPRVSRSGDGPATASGGSRTGGIGGGSHSNGGSGAGGGIGGSRADPGTSGSSGATSAGTGSAPRSRRADAPSTCPASQDPGPSGGASAHTRTRTPTRTPTRTCTRTRTRTRTGAGASTSSQEPEHSHLLEGGVTQYSDDLQTCDPDALAAELAKYIEFDPAHLSTQDIEALLRAYVEDRKTLVGAPKRQTEVVVQSSSQVGVGGSNHLSRMQIQEPHQSAKRPASPQVTRPSKHPKVTIEEIEDQDAFQKCDTESETNTLISETDTNTNTDTESEPDFPNIPAPFRPSMSQPSNPATQTSIHQAQLDPPPLQYPPSQPRLKPSTTTSLASLGQPHAPSQAGSHMPSQQGANPRTTQRPPSRPSASASASASAPKTGPGARLCEFIRATSPFCMATSHSGAPPTRSSQDKPTEREREMRARTKAADRMLNLDAEPKRARRGLRIPARLSKKTAKLAKAVWGAYRKLVTVVAGGRPREPDASASRGNLEDDLVPNNEEELVEKAAEAAGKEPQYRFRKPSSNDVHGYEKQILTTAKMHLFAMTLLEGAYQTRSWLMKMAKIVFIETWRQELPEIPIELPSSEVLQVMVNSLATARGQVKLAIRPILEYGFDFWKWDTSPEAVNHNIRVFSTIHPNVFHCTEFDPPYGHYENQLVTKSIAAALFGGPYSVGVTFRDYFDPMPLTTVAFILANMQFCLEEWETGQYKPRDLKTSDMLNKYIAHLRGLKEARRAARGRMGRLQEHWFEFRHEFSGAIPGDDEPIYQPITLRSEVRPDTPDSVDDHSMHELPADDDTSAESVGPENHADGRYTKKAKGKGRA